MWTAHKLILIRKNQQKDAQHQLQTFMYHTSHNNTQNSSFLKG
jgi:hypothetical protein